MKYQKLALSLTASCLSLVLFAGQAMAQSPSPKPKPTLAPGRMRACEARQSAVQTRLAQLIRMASNMLEVFDRHATQVKDYYTNTLIPKGITVPNYDALVADISTKRTAVETAWGKASTDTQGFSCTTGDPKGLLNQFRLDMQATKKALKDYRISIKNLIVAIRRVAPTPAASASPSASPEAE